jgi:hypothetical protein
MSRAVMQCPKNEELAEGHFDAASPIGAIRQVCMDAGNVSSWGRLTHVGRLCIDRRCVNGIRLALAGEGEGASPCHRQGRELPGAAP